MIYIIFFNINGVSSDKTTLLVNNQVLKLKKPHVVMYLLSNIMICPELKLKFLFIHIIDKKSLLFF